MNNKIAKIFLISIVSILIVAIIITIIIVNNKTKRKEFIDEVKEIYSDCEKDSTQNNRLHYANHSNALQTYNGNFTYFIRLNHNKKIVYFLIYSDKYAMASISDETYKLEYVNTPKTMVYKIKNANHYQELTDEYNKILAEAERLEKEKEAIKEQIIDDNPEEEEQEPDEIEESTENVTIDNNNYNPAPPQIEENNQSQPIVEELTYTIGEPTYFDCNDYYASHYIKPGHDKGNNSNPRAGGVTTETIDGKFIVTITSGLKNHGGYTIEVTNVEINGNNATITVKHGEADAHATVMVLTCPTIKVTFNKKPDSYNVIQENDGKIKKTG